MNSHGLWRILSLVFLFVFFSGCSSVPRKLGPTGTVVSILCAKGYDQAKDAAVDETTHFDVEDQQIVVGVTLKGYSSGARCEYVRYLNGKYLDHGSVPVAQPEFQTVFFTWLLAKTGKQRIKGQYHIKVYVNGRYAKEITYEVG